MSKEKPSFLQQQIMKSDMGYLYILLVGLKYLVWAVDFLLDKLFGFTITHGTREDCRQAQEHYEHSAHVVDVWYRGNWSLVIKHTPNNFLYTHNSYVHPHEILKRDNVTLMGISETHACFSVSEPGVNVHDTNKFPFLFIAQFLEAKKLIILPNKSFQM